MLEAGARPVDTPGNRMNAGFAGYSAYRVRAAFIARNKKTPAPYGDHCKEQVNRDWDLDTKSWTS